MVEEFAAAASLGINRHHVHAHAVLARFGAGFARNHRGLVIQDFASVGRRGARRFVNRLQLHAANRAVARMILDDPRVHPAGVERFPG